MVLYKAKECFHYKNMNFVCAALRFLICCFETNGRWRLATDTEGIYTRHLFTFNLKNRFSSFWSIENKQTISLENDFHLAVISIPRALATTPLSFARVIEWYQSADSETAAWRKKRSETMDLFIFGCATNHNWTEDAPFMSTIFPHNWN